MSKFITPNVVSHIEGCWVFGTIVFCVFWKFKILQNYKDTIWYSVFYTFGGIFQFLVGGNW
jgi:hypothetical protein